MSAPESVAVWKPAWTDERPTAFTLPTSLDWNCWAVDTGASAVKSKSPLTGV